MRSSIKKLFFKKQFVYVVFLVLVAVVIFVSRLLFLQPPPIHIQKENIAKTTNWKEYKNSVYHFAFKYPDVLLSNFQIETSNKPTESLQKMTALKSEESSRIGSSQSNTYNVVFEANGWKYSDTLDKFLSDGPFKDVKNYKRQKIILNDIEGLRITNKDNEKQSDAYFYYNLFKKGDYVYNFSLITDDPSLIDGNAKLLDEIISTAKFGN